MKKLLLLFTIIFFAMSLSLYSQEYKETNVAIPIANDSIYGTLLSPLDMEKPPIVILIAGSGATDRNGNQGPLTNNSLKFLAEGLSSRGIATYRYDKSVLSLLKSEDFKEESIVFSKFIKDAKFVLRFFKNENNYSKIYVAGHSQGSLVGMVSSMDIADGFISLAGPGSSIDIVLKEQLLNQAPQFEENITATLEKLKEGKKDTEFNPMLSSVFRLSVQPFLIDWMQYDPQEYIKKLTIPVLLINGTKDIQVWKKEANLLKKAKPEAQLLFIENMNHIFKEIDGGITENQQSYMNPDLPVMEELIEAIAKFVKRN